MFTRKVPLYFVFLSFLISGVILCVGFKLTKSSKAENETASVVTTIPSCDLNIARLKGFEFIHPLLYAEPNCESQELSSHKLEIEAVINSNKVAGNISAASVYLREFKQAQWISINENETYSPGSLLKVPELIAIYKMNEMNPGFLDRSIVYNGSTANNRIISFESKHVAVGKSYTIKELLYYMIVYSDNDATIMLNKVIDKSVFNDVFSDNGLKEPVDKSSSYPITARDYSIFMKELYNASYLNFKDSEACLSLLSKSEFKDGLLSGLPANSTVVHKFGEGGFDNAPNFSESAIVYSSGKSYLLTVMTKGTDMKKLPKVIGEISKKVYEIMMSRS